jgi:nucleoside-diphosphate-sugar epimerase
MGISSAWGRIFWLYGCHEYSQRLVPSVICSLLKGEVAKCSHGNQIRDFLYVQDVADAFVALLSSDIRGCVNIASGKAIVIKDIIFTIADYFGRRDLIQLGAIPKSLGEAPLVVADVARLFQEIGWEPKYELERAIVDTVEWWKN